MKKGLFLLLSMTLSYLSVAQVPNSFSYQMVIRNGNNELVANTTVGIRIGLLGVMRRTRYGIRRSTR